MKVLFIGNSHTFVHYVPARTAEFCKSYGQPIEPVMLTHPGMGLDWHLRQSQTYFNLLWGGYDAVILQHNAHPFPGKESLLEAGNKWQRSRRRYEIYLYMTWSEKKHPAGQAAMSAAYEALAERSTRLSVLWDVSGGRPRRPTRMKNSILPMENTALCWARPWQQRLSGARCWAWRSRRRVAMQMPRAWKGCVLIPE